MKPGIYTITNTENGHVYVGSAVNVVQRWRAHRSELKYGAHHSPYLQRAWQKHGESAFLFKKILICAPEHLLMFEQRAIDVLKPIYNMCPIAGSRLGSKHTPESIAKMSGENHRCFGKSPSLETRARRSESLKGNQNFKGHKHSAETRAKMSASGKGKVRSPEHCKNISLANKGRKLSLLTRAKMSIARRGERNAMFGRVFSLEHRMKISVGNKGKNKGKKYNRRRVSKQQSLFA